MLAPRGWRCFGVYGSGGDALFVAPERFGAKELLSPKQFKFDGAVVTALRVFGGTSGRFRVAEVIFRVFPTHRDFAEQVAKELEPPNRFEEGPYPSDILTYRGKEMVEFKTPRESDGLGTFNSLVANNQAIEGAAMLVGPDTDLLMTSVRLPRGLGSLAPVIIRRFESDAPSF